MGPTDRRFTDRTERARNRCRERRAGERPGGPAMRRASATGAMLVPARAGPRPGSARKAVGNKPGLTATWPVRGARARDKAVKHGVQGYRRFVRIEHSFKSLLCTAELENLTSLSRGGNGRTEGFNNGYGLLDELPIRGKDTL